MATRLTETLLAEMNRYLKGKMTELEREIFEKKLEDNNDLKKELQLEIELSEVIGDNSDYSIFKSAKNRKEVSKLKTKIRSDEYQEFSNKIKDIGKEYLENEEVFKSRKNYYLYFSIVGVIVLFLGIYFSQMNTSLDSYYNSYAYWDGLPSFTEKGQAEDLFSKGELAFKNKNYKEAVTYFEAINLSNELYPFSLMYLGVSYDKLNQNKKAIGTFKELTTTFSQENTKGYWYIVQIYLKLNDKNKVEETLNIILQSEQNYYYKEAFYLSEKIKK